MISPVQAGVRHGQDGRRQQEPDSEVQEDQNSLSSNRVSDQCWLRWESLRVRNKATSTVVVLRITHVSVTTVSS